MKKFNKHILEAVNRGIQLALDDFEDIEDNNTLSSKNDVIDSEDVIKNKIDLQNFVDLGLPSKTLWHKGTLGETDDTFGEWYAWGETEPKNVYAWHNYKYAKRNEENLTKYCNDKVDGYKGFTDNKETLDLCDDIAYLTNKHFRIPSSNDFEELLDNCNYEWITGDTIGIIFRSKKNGNELFFPASGFINDYGQVAERGKTGLFWANNISSDALPEQAYCLSIEQASNAVIMADRCLGLQIKPIWVW